MTDRRLLSTLTLAEFKQAIQRHGLPEEDALAWWNLGPGDRAKISVDQVRDWVIATLALDWDTTQAIVWYSVTGRGPHINWQKLAEHGVSPDQFPPASRFFRQINDLACAAFNTPDDIWAINAGLGGSSSWAGDRMTLTEVFGWLNTGLTPLDVFKYLTAGVGLAEAVALWEPRRVTGEDIDSKLALLAALRDDIPNA